MIVCRTKNGCPAAAVCKNIPQEADQRDVLVVVNVYEAHAEGSHEHGDEAIPDDLAGNADLAAREDRCARADEGHEEDHLVGAVLEVALVVLVLPGMLQVHVLLTGGRGHDEGEEAEGVLRSPARSCAIDRLPIDTTNFALNLPYTSVCCKLTQV